MNNHFDISVVIPVYNAEKTINICFKSVYDNLKDSGYSFEIILVNDGSIDNSLKLLEEIKTEHEPFVNILNQENAGVASARNAGLKIAKGVYVTFCDSDDKWLPDKTQIQMTYLLTHTDVDMVAGIFGIDKIDKIKRMKEENLITIKEQVFKNYFSPPTVLFKRSILDIIGLFNSNMRHAEEGLFFNNMVYHGRCILLNQKVTESITDKKRWGESGLSGNLSKMEQGELFNIYQAYKNKYISLFLYLCAVCFSTIKFFRRVFIKIIRIIIKQR
jgi:glycosyltransferase involved in cell wall biosynthesis